MSLEKEDFEQISSFIQEHLSEWLSSQSITRPPIVYEIELRERIVRVEEELKNQRELMKQGFDLMDKRFEKIDRRLFQFMIWSFSFTVSAAGIIIAVFKLT